MGKSPLIKIFLIIGFIISLQAQAETEDHYPFSTDLQRQQFQTLITEFRCLVCQNQNLADSNADLAKDLRLQVFRMVQNDKTNQEITQYMTDRYGEFILFKPPFTQQTYVLWLMPFILLIIGFVILWRLIHQRKSKQ